MSSPVAEFSTLTPENTALWRAGRESQWRAHLPARRPLLAGLPDVFASLRVPYGPQKSLVEDLRGVVDNICDTHWLRVYVHKPQLGEAIREMTGNSLTYRPWADFIVAGQIEGDARQELWQRDVGDNMVALAFAARLWEDPKYVHALKAHVGASLQYPTWGDDTRHANMDLACAHLARGIAVARDWLPELWTPDELAQMREVLRERMDALLRGAYGGVFWAGNWRDNHCQNCLAALGICGLTFLDEIPEAATWLAAAEIGFANVGRTCHADGSCYEGLPYWSYGFSFTLQYIETTRRVTGSDRLYDAPYLRNAFAYRLQSSTPDLSATLPFGDAVKHDYYGPAHLLHALARQYQNPHAQWLAENIPFASTGGADCEVWNLLWQDTTLAPEAPARALDTHFPDWDVAVTRSGWQADDYVLAVKSGFTNRNHSHLDAGALALAWGGEWLLTAPGYGVVGEGFWNVKGPRWTYYANSTESHTTLLINGENQRFDREARGTIETFEVLPDATRTVIDLTEAYRGVHSVRREILHRRDHEIFIMDTIELMETGTVEWLLQPGGTVELRAGSVCAHGRHGSLEAQMLWPPAAFAPRLPTSPHLDVAPESVQTYAVSQSGKSLRFICRIALHKADSQDV